MSKHRFGLGMAAVLLWAATGQAQDLTVRAFNAARYTETSALTFWVAGDRRTVQEVGSFHWMREK